MLAGAAVVVAALTIGVVLAVTGGAGDEEASPGQALAAAGCTFATYPDQGQQHVDTYEANVSYNSTAPTRGTHHVRPVIWGAYGDPVPVVAEVHNLEHGV